MLDLKEKEIKFDKDSLPPMLRQYFQIKEQNPGSILLFRVGDFYETYDEDATLVSKQLDIVLTSKEAGKGSRIHMAGVPYHSVDNYIRILISKGYRVAICDQVEDPKKAKGLVRREVTKIITSGTILDPEMLSSEKNNYLLCLIQNNDFVGLSYADISTGELSATHFSKYDRASIMEEVKRINPTEIVIMQNAVDFDEIKNKLTEQNVNYAEYTAPDGMEKNIEQLKIMTEETHKDNLKNKFQEVEEGSNHTAAKFAAGFIISYLKNIQKTRTLNLKTLKIYKPENYLILDSITQRNLELTQTLLRQEKTGSLLWVLDKTKTAMGARLLRKYILRPLTRREEILKRQNIIETFTKDITLLENLRRLLAEIYDLERITAKVEYKTVNARDLLALKKSLNILPEILELIKPHKDKHLSEIYNSFDVLQDLKDLLETSIHEVPPLTIKEGNIIKNNFNKELDQLREIKSNTKTWIAELENEERENTRIKSLKIGYNSVFGYYIEVTKSNLHLVPPHYIRKQTVANGERFINQQLKEYEAKILGAEEKIKNLEYEIFCQIRNVVADNSERLKDSAEILAQLDFFASTAYVSLNNNYVKPQIEDSFKINIKNGRHPVVEKVLKGKFIPNDVYFDENHFFLIITGPNMAGKSTYLRQSALITIMAQMGSFVPAERAQVGIADRIFTRVGASDDLHLGQSTFMVEMKETANIIRDATNKSLILLDEIGRGTSTQEGLSLAWAVAEYIHNKINAKTLFATHFHELTQLTATLKFSKNYRIDVKEKENEVIFLHKIVPGGADHSFALYVAYLAGIPKEIIQKAQDILLETEDNKTIETNPPVKQLTFFEHINTHPVLEELKKMTLEKITPIEALNKLAFWQEKLKGEK